MKLEKFLKFIPALAISLSLLSAGMILYFILKYGVDVPYMDQWEYVGFFDRLAKGTLTFNDLFKLQGEYRQFFPNLIFVSLGWLTKWNVRYEMGVIFLLACLVSFNIYRLASFIIKGKNWLKWILLFLANLFIFSPIQYENWLFGVQIEYFMPIACITTAMVIAFSRLNASLKLIFCMVLGIISTYSSINGILYWIILFPVLYLSGSGKDFFKKWPAISLWILGTIVTLIFYFNGYKKPESSPGAFEAFHHPLNALKYFFGILGNPIRIVHDLNHIIFVGGVLFSVFIALALYIVWHSKDKQLIRDSIIWIMLGLYSIMTAAMVTVGRVGFGVFQSLTSRYTTYTLYLVVATIFLSSAVILHRAKKVSFTVLQKITIVFLVAYVIYIKVDTYPTAVIDLKTFHSRIQHGKAGLLFINYMPHELCENKIYPNTFWALKRRANTLDSLGYLRPALIKSNVVQDIEDAGSDTTDYGSLAFLFPCGDNYYIASGLTIMPNTNGPADAILITYDNKKGQSIAFGLNNSDKMRWYWIISVAQVPCDTTDIKFWAFDANTAKAYRLRGSKRVIKQ
jgi:hypothetical protein